MTVIEIPPHLVDPLLVFLDKKIGLHITHDNVNALTKKLHPLAKEFGFDDLTACIEWLLSTKITKDEITTLARFLTVGETYFFRDENAFKTLEQEILPDIIQRQAKEKQLRIWSCASCTGEEAYSIAILLDQLIPDIEEWNISILATDINPAFLQIAQEGCYKPWSFRSIPFALKTAYFKQSEDGKYHLSPKIRKMVTFTYLNLIDETYPSLLNGTNAMDLILCNNVLIYFSEKVIDTVLNKLNQSLVDKGWLMVSGVEVPYIHHEQLHAQTFNQTTLFQKSFIPIRTPAPSPPPPVKRPRPTYVPKSIPKPKTVDPRVEIKRAFNEGLYEKVIELIKIEKDEHHLSLLTQAYANLGQLDEALSWCEKGIEKDSTDPELHLINAMILQEQSVPEEAMAALKKTLYLDPNCIVAHFLMGCHGEPRHFRNALKLLELLPPEQIVAFSEGMSVKKMREIIGEMERSQNG